MATYFFDTSALVKRYNEEPGSERVDEMLDDPDVDVIISSLTVIKSVSAFRRNYNRGEVSKSEMEELIGAFFQEALKDFVILPMDESLLAFSFELILEDDLRTLDSLQLSTALAMAEDLQNIEFVTADKKLAAIGESHNLDTVVPLS